ncbi:MAG: transcription antitermination factor NusB [Spirochaetia bacterium]|jgi:N utilization substance protein B|nr:transcription antitermination factor NusB [Spirochaetia bacterium]
MGARRKGRIIAFQVIFSWDINKTGIDSLYNLEWLDIGKEKITEESIIFAKLLIKGTLENISEIDEKIRKHIDNWDFKRISKVDLAILRLSTYSLLFQKEIAGNIIIDEAVDISRNFSSDESYRFINGVLDSIFKK